MRQDTIIKFRATAGEKERLRLASERSGRSVSALLRNAARDIATGRPVDGEFRKDLTALRRALNALVDETDDTPSKENSDAAKRLATKLLARFA